MSKNTHTGIPTHFLQALCDCSGWWTTKTEILRCRSPKAVMQFLSFSKKKPVTTMKHFAISRLKLWEMFCFDVMLIRADLRYARFERGHVDSVWRQVLFLFLLRLWYEGFFLLRVCVCPCRHTVCVSTATNYKLNRFKRYRLLTCLLNYNQNDTTIL